MKRPRQRRVGDDGDGRYVVFQVAEVAVPRMLFAEISAPDRPAAGPPLPAA